LGNDKLFKAGTKSAHPIQSRSDGWYWLSAHDQPSLRDWIGYGIATRL